MSGHPRRTIQEVACQQILAEDASVFSIQWLDFPVETASRLTSQFLLEQYLGYVRRFTLGIVRPHRSEGGIEFRLPLKTASLINFSPPAFSAAGERGSVTINICGGLLVQPHQCDRGSLTLGHEPHANGIRVTLCLSDYCPLILGSQRPSWLRKWLYRFTQAAIHKLVTIRFLGLLYRETVDRRATVRVVSVQIKNGEAI